MLFKAKLQRKILSFNGIVHFRFVPLKFHSRHEGSAVFPAQLDSDKTKYNLQAFDAFLMKSFESTTRLLYI